MTPAATPQPAVCSHGLTHIGRVRPRNEDAYLDDSERGLWAVADGMGGHSAGDYASRRIVEALAQAECSGDLDGSVAAVRDRLTAVDAELRRRAAALGPGETIASTVVVLLAEQWRYACLWAGDSRAYLLRDGAMRQLTVDHSLVQELVDGGVLSAAAARSHPQANVVTQAIGAGRLEFGAVEDGVRAGDRFLLCSDGLTGMVDDPEIACELGKGTPEEASLRLVDLALVQGGVDNVSVVVVEFRAD